MISPAMQAVAAVVRPRFTSDPMMSGRRVSSASGTRANGIPKDSTTWEMTRLCVAGSPAPSTASAGSMVSVRRASSGMRRPTNPCITTWPA